MATITSQPTTVKSILDIYDLNKSYKPTKDTLLLMSTQAGTTVVSKSVDLLLNPKIFNESLSKLYCPYDNGQYFNNIPLRG